MPTTPLQRMMFLQGQRCFFCNRAIPKGEASVEHLVPVSKGGSNHSDNLVACCKSLNTLFGDVSLKDKLRAILNQNGKFTCPNQPVHPQAKPANQPTNPAPASKPTNGRYQVA